MIDPRWLAEAHSRLGVREIVGPKHSSTIMGWIKRSARFLGMAVKDDETPWCGTFIADVMNVCGITPPPVAVRASAWASWGVRVSPRLGAVLIFHRPGGGHVGLYVGERVNAYRVLGGNQGNAVSETWIEKGRCITCRWPAGEPISTQPVVISATGALSSNEA